MKITKIKPDYKLSKSKDSQKVNFELLLKSQLEKGNGKLSLDSAITIINAAKNNNKAKKIPSLFKFVKIEHRGKLAGILENHILHIIDIEPYLSIQSYSNLYYLGKLRKKLSVWYNTKANMISNKIDELREKRKNFEWGTKEYYDIENKIELLNDKIFFLAGIDRKTKSKAA